MSRVAKATVLVFLLGLGACSPKSLYAAGQAWQRQACNDIEELERRSECIEAAGTTFERYQLTRR